MSIRRFAFLFAIVSALLSFNTAWAQNLPLRQFPPAAQFGTLTLKSLTEATVGDAPLQVSPGLRIFNPQNLMVLGNTILGTPYKVAYRLDTAGFLQEVWILTPSEIEERSEKFSSGWTFKLW